MSSNRDFLVVQVEHNFHVDGITHSVYQPTKEKAFNLAKEWKVNNVSVLVYECIAEAEIEQLQLSKMVLKK